MFCPTFKTQNQTSSNLNEGFNMSSSSLADGIRQAYEFLAQSAEKIFFDPKPQMIYKANTADSIVYQQKVLVRFLRPPPLAEPGPLIIKEVRPTQPPPPRPLVIRQYANPLPPLPPMILREQPPVPPAPLPTQTIIRQLPPVHPPPRSVVIECVPPLPPKPRDIIIERWMPYSSSTTKRQTIVQKAPPTVQYPRPKNVIYVYDPPATQIIRRVENLGIVRENPQQYATQYGTTLLDPQVLVEKARAVGVNEDITPPQPLISSSSSSSPYDSISTSSLYKGKKSSIPFDLISTASSQGFLVSHLLNDRTDHSLDSLASRKKMKNSK